MATATTTQQILTEFQKLPEGCSLNARDLLHIANRTNVDQALSRLTRQGRLERITRGSYLLPSNRMRMVMPDRGASVVVEAFASRRGEFVASDPAAAAASFGLTTSNRTWHDFVTSGPSKSLVVGHHIIHLHHAPPWQLLLPGCTAGDAIRAIAWLGPETAGAALAAIDKHLRPLDRTELLNVRAQLPEWVAKCVTSLATGSYNRMATPASPPSLRGAKPRAGRRSPRARGHRGLQAGIALILSAGAGLLFSLTRTPQTRPSAPAPTAAIVKSLGFSGSFGPAGTTCPPSPSQAPNVCSIPVTLEGAEQVQATWTGTGTLALKLTDVTGRDVSTQVTGEHGALQFTTPALPQGEYDLLVMDAGPPISQLNFAVSVRKA